MHKKYFFFRLMLMMLSLARCQYWLPVKCLIGGRFTGLHARFFDRRGNISCKQVYGSSKTAVPLIYDYFFKTYSTQRKNLVVWLRLMVVGEIGLSRFSWTTTLLALRVPKLWNCFSIHPIFNTPVTWASFVITGNKTPGSSWVFFITVISTFGRCNSICNVLLCVTKIINCALFVRASNHFYTTFHQMVYGLHVRH